MGEIQAALGLEQEHTQHHSLHDRDSELLLRIDADIQRTKEWGILTSRHVEPHQLVDTADYSCSLAGRRLDRVQPLRVDVFP